MHKNVAELKRLRDSNPLDNSIGSSTAIQKNTLKYLKKNSTESLLLKMTIHNQDNKLTT